MAAAVEKSAAAATKQDASCCATTSKQTGGGGCCSGAGVAGMKVSGILLSSLWSNPAPVRKDAVALIGKIFENILKNPSEQKFRAVNIEKTRTKLESAAGAVDYLLAAGFKKTATHYELPTDFDLEILTAYHSALAAQDAKAAAEYNDSLSADAKASIDEARRIKEEKDAKRKEARKLEEMRRKDRAQDYKPPVASTASNLKFGATKASLPPPAKKCGPSA